MKALLKDYLKYKHKQNKTMKKYILALALLFICHIGFAQNLNSLFDEFGKEPNAECINISQFMMTIGKMIYGK
jgi:hypothetical protein